MKTVMPDSCLNFACIAGDCRHSCCVGWEIDIDDASLARYRTVPGAMGQRLQSAMEVADGAAHFRLTKEERCPFLNQDGLCDMILELGKDSLCQICADHPRFRHDLADRMEMGLGLCCEAAGRLILGWREPVRLVAVEDDGAVEEPDEEELALLSLRDALIAQMQDRSLPFEARLEALAQRCRYPELPWTYWRDFLLTLERLDDAWSDTLSTLPDAPPPLSPSWDVPFEQLTVYLLYRHLPDALEDGDILGRVRFCVLITKLLRALLSIYPTQTMDTLVELARLYSSEIEYSDENVLAILDELARLD